MNARTRKHSTGGFGIAAIFASIVCCLALPGTARGQSSTPHQESWVTDEYVYAIVDAGDTIYIGGDFNHVGPYTGSGVPIDTATSEALATYPIVAGGDVYACVLDGAGGWFIGGDFTSVGGVARSGLARILSDGSVDPDWDPGADNEVYALAVSGSTVYAGGELHEHRRPGAQPYRRPRRHLHRFGHGLEPGRKQWPLHPGDFGLGRLRGGIFH